jgi:hypothetical protein
MLPLPKYDASLITLDSSSRDFRIQKTLLQALFGSFYTFVHIRSDMASTVNPSDKNATAHILQGVGTWTEDQGRGIGNANLEKGKSEGLQHTISGGLAVENHLTSQYTPTFGKSDMGATDAAWPSRYTLTQPQTMLTY